MENVNWPLLAKYFDGEATGEEKRFVESWLARYPEWRGAFEKMHYKWRQPISDHHKFDMLAGRRRLKEKLYGASDVSQKETNGASQKIAAVIALLMTIGAAFFMLFNSDLSTSHNPVTYQTMVGEKKIVQLGDGSRVHLNADSRFEIGENFGLTHRRLSFSGEAFFEVHPDADLPFIIQLDSVSVRVVGTSFNINTFQHTEIIVATGLVEVRKGENKVRLNPLQKTIWKHDERAFVIAEADTTTSLAWRQDKIIFDDTPMPEAVEILERWYNVDVDFANSAISNCYVTGTFQNESLKNVIRSVCFSNNLRFTIEGNQVTLSGEGCKKTRL